MQSTRNSLTDRLTFVLALALFLVPAGAGAQVPTSAPAPRPVPEATAAAETAPDSPRASLQAYLDAARAARWQEAGRYLSVPDDQKDRRAELAERLKAVLDRHLWFDLEEISPASEGRRDDGLQAGLEEVGTIQVGDGRPTPLRLVHASDERGAHWAFARGTVQQIDGWYEALEARWIIDWLARNRLDPLLRTGPFDVMWWQWMALLVVAAIAWFGGRLLGSLTRAVLRRASARTATHWDDRLVRSLGPPIRAAWTLLIFASSGQAIGLSVPAERVISQTVTGAAVAALFWALWRSVDVVVDLTLSRPWAASNPATRHVLTIGSNLLKGAIAALGGLALLAAFGYPVTTLLAGLGIGGLAFAFGAQKTVENLFGSIAIAVDQPFRVGDTVRVGEVMGTVEDIGLRSTRLRTPDRTIISIPNGGLADQRLESLTARDRMRLATTIGLEYSTTRAQMQQVLDGCERVLRNHPKIWPDAMVVKFKEFGDSSLDIEIMAWFDVPTWEDFQQCRQEALLQFMQVVEEAGTAFAFPTRTVHMVHQAAFGPAPT